MNVNSCILFCFAFFEVLRLVFLTTENNTKMFHFIDRCQNEKFVGTHLENLAWSHS